MSGREHFEGSNISDNISSLVATDLKPGEYGFEEDGKAISVKIRNTEFGQFFEIETEDVRESVLITIDVSRQKPDNQKPVISATSTRRIKGESVTTYAFWHSDIPKDTIGRLMPVMNEPDLTNAIELAKSPKKQLLPGENI